MFSDILDYKLTLRKEVWNSMFLEACEGYKVTEKFAKVCQREFYIVREF